MSPYIPVLGVLFFSAILLGAMIAVSLILGPGRYNKVKYMPYECGIDPTPRAAGGGRFPIKFYITAMMFLVFDLEIAFLYPWAVAFDQLSLFAIFAMIVFLVLLLVAYYYEYKRGGMEWD